MVHRGFCPNTDIQQPHVEREIVEQDVNPMALRVGREQVIATHKECMATLPKKRRKALEARAREILAEETRTRFRLILFFAYLASWF